MDGFQKLTNGAVTTKSFVGSRAYTFLDSYIHSKQRNYNALYSKNKEILKIENEAIQLRSPGLLYEAYFEQTRILDTVVDRILSFATLIKQDVENNIAQILPTTDMLNEYIDAIEKIGLVPRFKYVYYDMSAIKYMDLNNFFNLFKSEIKELCMVDDSTTQIETPTVHSRATIYLNTAFDLSRNPFTSMLDSEKISIMTPKKLKGIRYFFERKSLIKSVVNSDFKKFIVYLRQYKHLYKMVTMLKPTVYDDLIDLNIGGARCTLSFNDYLVVYKHFSSITKALLSIVDHYNNRFFNKIYSIQSNIEVYKSIMEDIIDYANNTTETLAEATAMTTDTFTGIGDYIGAGNGHIANAFLNDNTTKIEEDDIDELEPDDIVSDVMDVYDNNKDIKPIDTLDTYVSQLQENILSLSLFTPYEILNETYDTLTEANDISKDTNKIVQGILKWTREANRQFRHAAREFRMKDDKWVKRAAAYDINHADLSNFVKDMFPYWNSIPRVFDTLTIPQFTSADYDLYSNEPAFMNKYFSKICTKEGELNKNILRGLTPTSDRRKIRMQFDQIKSAYPKVVNLIPEIQKLMNKVSKDMTMVNNTLKRIRNMEIPISESVLLSRSIYKDSYYDLLLEKVEILGDNPEDNIDEIENSDTKNDQTNDSEDEQRTIPVDKEENKEANDNIDLVEKCISWARLVSKVLTMEMDVLDEAHVQCIRFIKKVMRHKVNDTESKIVEENPQYEDGSDINSEDNTIDAEEEKEKA